MKFYTLKLYCTMTWQGPSPGDGHHMQAGECQAHESRGDATDCSISDWRSGCL